MSYEIIWRVWERGLQWGSGMAAKGKARGKKHSPAEPPNFLLCQVEPEAQENTGEKSQSFLTLHSQKRIKKLRLGTLVTSERICLRGTDSKVNCWWWNHTLNTAFIDCLLCPRGALGHKDEQRPCLQNSKSGWEKCSGSIF